MIDIHDAILAELYERIPGMPFLGSRSTFLMNGTGTRSFFQKRNEEWNAFLKSEEQNCVNNPVDSTLFPSRLSDWRNKVSLYVFEIDNFYDK